MLACSGSCCEASERDGVKPDWDGTYITCPGWEITECGTCGVELSREEITVREFHNVHTHFTPVLECVPYSSTVHALIRICDDCGTEVPTYAAHNCPVSDAPYTDDGDMDAHVRYVKCDDCGYMVPQRQAHKWVHDGYGYVSSNTSYPANLNGGKLLRIFKDARVRSGPGTDKLVLGNAWGYYICVDEVYNDGTTWCKIIYGDRYGYVSSTVGEYLEVMP